MPVDPTPWIPAGIAVAQAITRGGPRRQYKWNKRAAEDTNVMNRANAQWQLDEQKKIQQEQRAYDDPTQQMARFKAAGLNPNLIYGGGSGSSGGTFSISAPGIAPSRIDAPSASYPDVAGGFVQASQALAQTELIQQKEVESEAKTEMIEIQKAIARTNPMLDPSVAEWVKTSMQETARLKAVESRVWMSTEDGYMRVARRVNQELDAMEQKLGLNTADLAIKNKIFESKEFENAVKEIQARWLKDGEVTPQHLYQLGVLMMSRMIPQR